MLRLATPRDLEAIVRIENRCFVEDRFPRSRMKYLLLKGKAEFWLDEEGGNIRGYVMLLYTRRHAVARIYSLAVDPDFQRQGVAARLVAQAEASARARACRAMRLEIRVDNYASQQVFKRMGYQELARLPAYYDNKVDGIRYEKVLVEQRASAAGAAAQSAGVLSEKTPEAAITV